MSGTVFVFLPARHFALVLRNTVCTWTSLELSHSFNLFFNGAWNCLIRHRAYEIK